MANKMTSRTSQHLSTNQMKSKPMLEEYECFRQMTLVVELRAKTTSNKQQIVNSPPAGQEK
jgi:hypothetical protein